jgi:GNAT superfamily N-acetyltransferase
VPPGIEIRRAGPEDGQQLAAMSDVIWRTQVQSPVRGVMLPETVAETEEGWAGLVNEAETAIWLALQAGQVVSMQGYWPAEQAADNPLVPANCIELSVAGTRAEARGQGIGLLLTRYGLAQARAAGYDFCETDWRSTNLLSSRFWPRRGFRPTAVPSTSTPSAATIIRCIPTAVS